MLRCGSDPDCTENGFCWLPCAAELCLLDGLHFLLNICKKHTVIKFATSPQRPKEKNYCLDVTRGRAQLFIFCKIIPMGPAGLFFPLFSTSLNFYRYSAVKSFTHSHVS